MDLDIFRGRTRSGASLEQVAQYAGVPVEDLTEWERRAQVPRKHAARVKWALWASQRDAALARSGLPECEWMARLATAAEPPEPQELATHVDACPACLRRSEFVNEHLEPMPPMGSGPVMYALALLGRLSPWQESAAAGAMIILAMGGIGVIVFIVMGVVNLDASYLLGASALFAVLVLSGAAGGIVHYHTRSLRAAGTLGHYLSSVLTVLGYLGAIFAMAAMGAAVVGWDAIGSDMEEMITTPTGWIVSGVGGLLFGLVFGRATRD